MNTNEFQTISYEVSEGVCIITIDREDQLNALNLQVLQELRLFFEACHEMDISGIILTGSGNKAFIAGADIKEMHNLNVEQAKDFSYQGQQVTLALEECRFPVIAAVNGFALGGGLEMALACDFIFASSDAMFSFPEVCLGLIPGFGGTQRLAKIVGRHRAKELIYSGRRINVEQAKFMGLVLEVYDSKESLVNGAKEKIKQIQKNSPFAISQAKLVINRGADLSVNEGLEIEKEQFGLIFNSHDMQEGVAAFVEKRKPKFIGK